MYYWGNYSSTLYHYKKNLTDEKLAEHKKSLLEIITKSNELELKTPPGVYAELGYIYYNAGDFIKAEEYFSFLFSETIYHRAFAAFVPLAGAVFFCIPFYISTPEMNFFCLKTHKKVSKTFI